MRRAIRSSRPRQRGSAMLVTLIVISALLAGAAALVSLQVSANRSVDLTHSGTAGLYCAEAALSAARPVVANSYAQWSTALAASAAGDTSEPLWLSAGIGSHDLDGDGVADFTVHIKDNGDEGTNTDDPTADTDLQVYIVADCIKYPDTPKRLAELVLYNGQVPCFPGQQGGCDGDGNSN
ncbi:MAG: hypothetical protein JNL83_20990 [Myxococcales bacterium]|nr:hypothetical protein [Myxococcales bacterium]